MVIIPRDGLKRGLNTMMNTQHERTQSHHSLTHYCVCVCVLLHTMALSNQVLLCVVDIVRLFTTIPSIFAFVHFSFTPLYRGWTGDGPVPPGGCFSFRLLQDASIQSNTTHTKKKKVCLTLSINIGNNGVKKTYKELTMLPVFLMVFPRWSRGERQPHHHLPRVPYICRAAGGGVPERADVPDQRSQVCIDFLNELHLTVFVCNIRYHINVPRVPEHSIQSIDANTPATRCSLFRNQVCENKIACIIGERWPVW